MNDDFGEEILVACTGDLESVCELVERYPQHIDWQDPVNHISLLHSLVYNNACEACRILLDSGADPNCMNKNGESPLHWAVRMNQFECVQLLLEYGADVNLADKSLSTALHAACAVELPEVLPLLLQYHCNLSLLDLEGKTPKDIVDESETEAAAICSCLLQRYIGQHPGCTDTNNDARWEDIGDPSISYYLKYSHNSPEDFSKSGADKVLALSTKSSPKPFIAGSLETSSPWARPSRSPVKKSNTRKHAPHDHYVTRSFSTDYLPLVNRVSNETGPLRRTTDRLMAADPVDDERRSNGLPARSRSPTTRRGEDEALPFIAGSNLMTQEESSKRLRNAYSPPAPLRDRPSLFPYAPFSPPKRSPAQPKIPNSTIKANKKAKEASAPQTAIDTQKFHWVPFQPSVAAFLDVFISVEQCVDCHLHNWSSWHVEEHYTKTADATLKAVLEAMHKNYRMLRVFAFKVMNQCSYKASARVGSLEVVMAIKTSATDNTKWSTKTIHSKLATLSWPRPSSVASSALAFVNMVIGKHAPTELPTRLSDTSENKADSLQKAAEHVVSRWQDNFAGHTTAPHGNTSETYACLLPPPAAFLTSIPPPESGERKSDLELSAMMHFLVYDGRGIHNAISEQAKPIAACEPVNGPSGPVDLDAANTILSRSASMP